MIHLSFQVKNGPSGEAVFATMSLTASHHLGGSLLGKTGGVINKRDFAFLGIVE